MNCNCGKTTRDNTYICDDCLTNLARALGDIPWLVEQLDITLTKTRGIDYTALGGSPSSERPLMLPFAAYEASKALTTALSTWVRFCHEEQIRHQSPKPGLPTDTPQAMSAWLLWRVDGLALSDMGPDAVADLTKAVRRAFAIIDRPAERKYAGPCECGRDLYSKPGAKLTKCRGCDREYDVESMVSWMRAGVLGRLVTAHEGATLLSRFELPTAQKTIDSWHDRKRILDHGRNPEGRLLYLIDDLIALAAQGGKMSA